MQNYSDVVLDCVFELRTKIDFFLRPDAGELFNRRDMISDEKVIKDVLISLRNKGHIYLSDENEDDDSNENYDYHNDIIESSLNTPDLKGDWIVSLTEKGGEKWERLLRPNWNQYTVEEYGYSSDESYWEVEIKAFNKSVLNSIVSNCSEIIMPNSVSDILPCKPVYWKKTEGYCVSFNISGNAGNLISDYISSTFTWTATK